MTTDKDFKNLVRARMTKTGESYAAARAKISTSRGTSVQPEDHDVRVIQESSGRWAARNDSYPDLVGFGSAQHEAAHQLLEQITQYESDWRNQIDDENVRYIELQDE